MMARSDITIPPHRLPVVLHEITLGAYGRAIQQAYDEGDHEKAARLIEARRRIAAEGPSRG